MILLKKVIWFNEDLYIAERNHTQIVGREIYAMKKKSISGKKHKNRFTFTVEGKNTQLIRDKHKVREKRPKFSKNIYK